MDKTDKILIDAHCRGEKAAFVELVRRHGDGLLGYFDEIPQEAAGRNR